MSTFRPIGVALDQTLAGFSGESALVAELQTGSEEAFAYLVGVYQNPIYNMIFHMLGNQAEAADVLQDVFVKVFRGIRQFHQESSLRTWIYKIAVREALNERRSRSRRLSHEPISFDATVSPDWGGSAASNRNAESPYRLVEEAERQHAVRRALASVAQPYRAVLILRGIEDLSYEEIAQVLGVAEGTVKSRLKRGRELLRRKLECQLGPKG
jgi:RNA polymerase sigma-70 factor (ECF subfamily)